MRAWSLSVRLAGMVMAMLLLVAPGSSSSALEPTATQANRVQRENAHRGNSGWAVAPAPQDAIQGYASQVSVLPGRRIEFHVATGARRRYRVVIYRLGWYGGAGGRRVACLPSCRRDRRGIQQPAAPAPAPDTGLVDTGWSVTDRLRVRRSWVSGYYIANFVITRGGDRGKGSWYPFIVRRARKQRSAIAVQAPVNTWAAYNSWGGKSLYEEFSSQHVRASHVSFNRPLEGDNQPVFGWEYQLVRFLEREGYDVSYTTDVDTDRDPASLRAAKLIISAGHDEYWSKRMRDAFDALRDSGHNLVFTGADVADWQVRYENRHRTLVGYKSQADPVGDPSLKTVMFRNLASPRPQCELLGIQYQGGLSHAANQRRDYSVVPASVRDAWMRGTGFRAGSTLRNLVGYEWDAVQPGCNVPPLTVFFHYDGSPSGADAVRYRARSGARIFSTGSLQFTWGLDSFGGHQPDRRLQRFTRNLLDDLAPHSRKRHRG
jgi:N,N-dimethylformamidase beta subunit-like protein